MGTGPYSARVARTELEAQYGAGNVVSTTVPPTSGKMFAWRASGILIPESCLIHEASRSLTTSRPSIPGSQSSRSETQATQDKCDWRRRTCGALSSGERFRHRVSRQSSCDRSTGALTGLMTIRGITTDTGRMQLVAREFHGGTGHVGGEAMGQAAVLGSELGLSRENSETIGFVLTSLLRSAIDLDELKEWCYHVIGHLEVGESPGYLFDLAEYKGVLAGIYKPLGFVPSWKHTDESTPTRSMASRSSVGNRVTSGPSRRTRRLPRSRNVQQSKSASERPFPSSRSEPPTRPASSLADKSSLELVHLQ